MKILVGSQAAKHWFPDWREPQDTDYFVSEGQKVEREPGIEYFSHPGLYRWFGRDEERIATTEELYTIKVSHAFWALKNGTWSKHMNDILSFQKRNVEFIPELYDIMYNIWVEVHGAKKVNLNQEPEDFFNEHVPRKYDHDSIHHSVAYGDVPMFEKILRDGHAVAVDRSKFDNLSHEDKCRLVREEVYATALERKIIPSGYTGSPRAAYAYAMRQLITSYSKGWFPLWVVLNYSDVYKPDRNYVQYHLDNAHKLILLED